MGVEQVRCNLWECDQEIRLKTLDGDYYCSEHCALMDSKKSVPSLSFVKTVKFTMEELGELLGQSRKNEIMIAEESLIQSACTGSVNKRSGDGERMSSNTEQTTEEENQWHGEETPSSQESATATTDVALIPPSELTPRPETLSADVSQSMNLIDDSVSQLHGLMSFVATSVKNRNKDSCIMGKNDPAAIMAAVGCAKQMAALMKMKVELVKLKEGR